MNNIQNEIKELIIDNSYLILTGTTISNGISVNISYLKEFIRSYVGAKTYKKYQDTVIEELERARDKIYSRSRYRIKTKASETDHNKLEYLVNRTKKSSRAELGSWICGVRDWDTVGVLTLSKHCRSDKDAENYVNILVNYLTGLNLITDFFYCVEYSSHFHINFYCRTNPQLTANLVRQKIRSFWFNNYGIHWVRKYRKSKESQSYWFKDINSEKQCLSNGCWNIYHDLMVEETVNNPLKHERKHDERTSSIT